MGIVVRGSSSPVQAPKKQAPPIRHRIWSMCASGWQLAQEKLPVEEAKALWNAARPRRTSSGSGSPNSAILAVGARADGLETSTTETVFSTEFST
jgi:hypothetical protein